MLRKIVLLGVGLAWVAWANEPFSNSPNLKPPPPQPPSIVIGAIYNLTGPQADLDGPALQGALLAVDEVNRNGGIRDKRIRLVVVDGGSDAAELQRKTKDLLDAQKPVVVIGLSDSDLVRACAPLAVERKIPFVTSGATSPQLPSLGRDFYLACFSDNAQAAAAAEFALQQGWSTAAVVEEADMEYSRLLASYFRAAFTQREGKIVELNQNPQVVFVSCGPQEARQRVDGLRQGGYAGPILGGDSFDGPHLGDDSQIFYTTHAYLPDQPRFVEMYLKLYPLSQPTSFSALGYDTTKLVLHAAEKARSLDPEGMSDALDLIGEFDGVTGDFYYSGRDRIPHKTVFVLQNPERKLAARLVPTPVPSP